MLAECYDASGSHTDAAARLSNLSARAGVSDGEGTLIAGFVVGGHGRQRILVRGLGPALRPHGVAEALADPRLRVYEGPTLIAENDDWGDTPVLRAAAVASGAAALAGGSTDAALVLELPAGAYTVHLNGRPGTRGVGLIELFALPPQ